MSVSYVAAAAAAAEVAEVAVAVSVVASDVYHAVKPDLRTTFDSSGRRLLGARVPLATCECISERARLCASTFKINSRKLEPDRAGSPYPAGSAPDTGTGTGAMRRSQTTYSTRLKRVSRPALR